MLLSKPDSDFNEVYFYHATGRVLTGRCYIKSLGDKATLYGVYVEESYRGLGEGQRMIQEVIGETLRTTELQKLELSVGANNRIAQHIYFKHGFRFDHPNLGGASLLWMTLNLEDLRQIQ